MQVDRRYDPSPLGGTSWTVWSGEPWESKRLLRVSLCTRPRLLGFRLSALQESGWVLALSAWWTLHIALPWLPVPKWADERETLAELHWSNDARLPSLYLRLALHADMMFGGPWTALIDLIAVVLGRWSTAIDKLDAYVGTVVLPGFDGDHTHAITLDVQRYTMRWKRQWWPALVEYGIDVRANTDEDAWPDFQRPHKGPTFAQGMNIARDMDAAEAVEVFVKSVRDEADAMRRRTPHD